MCNGNINIGINNVDKLYKFRKYSKKASIIGNVDIHNEIRFIRRIFSDGFMANESFFELRRYQVYKSSLSKYIGSLHFKNNLYFVIGVDFQKFLKYHGEYLLDIYRHHSDLSKKKRLIIFSMLAVDLFYKWRKMRNDSIRSGNNYDNRRKQSSMKIDMSSFDNFVINEAKSYRNLNMYKDYEINEKIFF